MGNGYRRYLGPVSVDRIKDRSGGFAKTFNSDGVFHSHTHTACSGTHGNACFNCTFKDSTRVDTLLSQALKARLLAAVRKVQNYTWEC
eukprot:1675524-Amphidinium_carterae.1